MSAGGAARAADAARYDGLDADALAARLGAPAARVRALVPSTMDEAHAWAAPGGAAAPHGALVVADAQSAGRGRAGRVWQSAPGAGVWATVVLRPAEREGLGVLSLRAGLELAGALAPFAGGPVALKWPNDLLVAGRKLAGILVEARWRDERPEWAAVGVGVNLRAPPGGVSGAALVPGSRRLDVLGAVWAAVMRAAARTGALSAAELRALAALDALRGRALAAPVSGTAVGIAADGALLVRDARGTVHGVRDASVVLAPPGTVIMA